MPRKYASMRSQGSLTARACLASDANVWLTTFASLAKLNSVSPVSKAVFAILALKPAITISLAVF